MMAIGRESGTGFQPVGESGKGFRPVSESGKGFQPVGVKSQAGSLCHYGVLTLIFGSILSLAQPAFAQGNSAADAAVPAPASVGGFWSIVFSGGWVGVMIVLTLLVLSLIAAYLIIEQFILLRKKEIMPTGLAEEVRQLLAQGRLPDADAACRKRPSPLAFVLVSGLTEIDFGWQAMEKAMEDAVAEQAAKLYRKIEYLSVIGNLAPMCGLLGTVTGMIMAFQQVAVTQGTAGAAQLAEGIYSALVTTVAGLVVAIPSLGAFAVFRNRVDQLIAETAYLAQHVFVPVRRRATALAGRGSAASVSPPSPPRAQG